MAKLAAQVTDLAGARSAGIAGRILAAVVGVEMGEGLGTVAV